MYRLVYTVDHLPIFHFTPSAKYIIYGIAFHGSWISFNFHLSQIVPIP